MRSGSSGAREFRRVPLRRVTPGATHFITKKTNDDIFWLRPDPTVRQVIEYLLFLKANRYGIQIHDFQVMSNHIHLVITDPRGKYPAFMREFLSESGKALKLVIGTDRRIWSGERYSQVELLDRDAVDRFTVYGRVNPNRADLTTARGWPGSTSACYRYGETISVRRPDLYFSEKRPERAEIVLTPPPERMHNSLDAEAGHRRSVEGEAIDVLERAKEYQAHIEVLVEREEANLARERARRGRRLLGSERVRRIARETRGSRPFGNRNPRYATRDPSLMRAAIESHREFEIAHAIAKRCYISGDTDTTFPVGTYGYREQLRVRVARGGRAA